MKIKCVKSLKLCQYVLYCVTFLSLLIPCYFIYMKEAIQKAQSGATTVIQRSVNMQYEAPTIIICPEPGYKKSIFEKYNLSVPARRIFRYDGYGQENLDNLTVLELYEELGYKHSFLSRMSKFDKYPGILIY